MKKKIIRISVLLGLLIFVYIVYRIGPLQIWDNIKKITWQNFLILMALRLLYWLLRTINWKVILDRYEDCSSLLHMFAARMSSHAVSQLTPSAQVGGEAARIFMLNCSSRKISIASVVVDKTVEFISVIVFTIIGVAIAITRFAMPVKMRIIFIGFVVLASALLLLVFLKQKKGLFSWIVGLLEKMKIKPKFLERNRDKIAETDAYISDFYRNHRRAFLLVFLLYSLLILLWTAEIHLTLVFVGAENITFLDSFLITALGNIAFIFPLIPAQLGIYEATYVALFAILRKGTDVGFTLVVMRRILALLWAGIGLLGMWKHSHGEKRIPG
jgi:uncharacterized protein (TIRG00374 family)